MNSDTGKILDHKDLWRWPKEEQEKFELMPREGSIIRFEGTKMTFRVKRITPFKVILKPVPSSEYDEQNSPAPERKG